MTGVPLNPVIYVRFNEELDATALGSATIRLRNVTDGWIDVANTASLNSSGRILQIVPDGLLEAGKQYYVSLEGITDTDGDVSWSHATYFNTAADAVEDDRQAMVLAMSPPSGETGVGVNAGYAARFDERMNPLSFNTDNGQRFNAQFSEDNHVMRYERLGTLNASSEVTEQIPELIDLAGNAVVAASTTFTTANGPDFVLPRVVDTAIANNQQDVATNPVLEWVFSEAIDPVSVTRSGVYLQDSVNGVVPTTVSLSSDGKDRKSVV